MSKIISSFILFRLEFSKKDMAYKMYGISKPNTFVSSFVKRAEGGDTKETNGKKGKKEHNETSK